jgi:hypothetical protein
MAEEAKRAQAIVDGDDHDVSMVDQIGSPVQEDGATPRGETAAVDPDHDRSPVRRRAGGFIGELTGPDIQRETVLALRSIATGFGRLGESARRRGLRSTRPERGRIAHAVPGNGRLGRAPPEVPLGSTRVGNSQKRPVILLPYPSDPSSGNRHDTVHGKHHMKCVP